jgi:hypothetical protein
MTKHEQVFEQSEKNIASKIIPYELLDMILFQLDDINIALDLQRIYISKKIAKRHKYDITTYDNNISS